MRAASQGCPRASAPVSASSVRASSIRPAYASASTASGTSSEARSSANAPSGITSRATSRSAASVTVPSPSRSSALHVSVTGRRSESGHDIASSASRCPRHCAERLRSASSLAAPASGPCPPRLAGRLELLARLVERDQRRLPCTGRLEQTRAQQQRVGQPARAPRRRAVSTARPLSSRAAPGSLADAARLSTSGSSLSSACCSIVATASAARSAAESVPPASLSADASASDARTDTPSPHPSASATARPSKAGRSIGAAASEAVISMRVARAGSCAAIRSAAAASGAEVAPVDRLRRISISVLRCWTSARISSSSPAAAPALSSRSSALCCWPACQAHSAARYSRRERSASPGLSSPARS